MSEKKTEGAPEQMLDSERSFWQDDSSIIEVETSKDEETKLGVTKEGGAGTETEQNPTISAERAALLKTRNAIKTKKWRDKQRMRQHQQKEELKAARETIIGLKRELETVKARVVYLEEENEKLRNAKPSPETGQSSDVRAIPDFIKTSKVSNDTDHTRLKLAVASSASGSIPLPFSKSQEGKRLMKSKDSDDEEEASTKSETRPATMQKRSASQPNVKKSLDNKKMRLSSPENMDTLLQRQLSNLRGASLTPEQQQLSAFHSRLILQQQLQQAMLGSTGLNVFNSNILAGTFAAAAAGQHHLNPISLHAHAGQTPLLSALQQPSSFLSAQDAAAAALIQKNMTLQGLLQNAASTGMPSNINLNSTSKESILTELALRQQQQQLSVAAAVTAATKLGGNSAQSDMQRAVSTRNPPVSEGTAAAAPASDLSSTNPVPDTSLMKSYIQQLLKQGNNAPSSSRKSSSSGKKS